jgi:hypothetical protein
MMVLMLHCFGMVAAKRKLPISEHLYSTMCGLQTWVLGFFYPEDHDEQ